jgi:cytochrome c-type biogenesis protein CcmH/NrfF
VAEKRLQKLSEELRCLVCQNQTIADSNAELAQDLRREVRGMIKDGKTDKEIVDFMVVRYGDFVLYRPPVKGITLLLWGGPIALMLLGFFACNATCAAVADASMLKTSHSQPTKPAAPIRCSRNSTRNDPVCHFRHPDDCGGRRLCLAAALAGPARPQSQG